MKILTIAWRIELSDFSHKICLFFNQKEKGGGTFGGEKKF
jgi:hypothetical protein